MLRRLTPILLTLLVVVLGVTALVARPDTAAPRRTADFVVLVGVAGLRWEDVDPQTTPTLWRMAQEGSIGSLSTRSARRPTCPLDGWLTLGAGSYAAWNGSRPSGVCPPADVTVEQPDRIGANLPQQEGVVAHNQDRLPWGAVPGSLSESVRCSVAIGPGAAVAAARPFGRVDRYAEELPADPADLLGSCVLSIVDLGVVTGDDPATRAAEARRADAALATVLAARPSRSLVVVAGVSDTSAPARLHVAVADGPGWEKGWLTSASTAREGYLQLIDLAPTALSALGRPMPERLFLGRPAVRVDGRPADLAAAITATADADREAGAQRTVAGWFFTLLAVAEVALFVAVLPLLRRARRHAGPHGPPPVSRRVVATVELLLVAVALAVPAALLADAVPWWRGDHAGWWFALVTAALIAVATALVRFAPGHERTLGPLGAVAGLATLIVGADVLSGARLQLNSVVGYSALEGGRFSGLGTVGLGVFLAAALLSAGWLAQRVHREWRPMVMVAVGGGALMVVGSPYLGADPIGAVALTAGVAVAAAISTGGWLTVSRLVWAAMAGLALTIGYAVLDVRRPAEERGSLGRFLTALGDGTGGLTLHRSSTANFETLVNSPLTAVAVLGALLVWFALLQPWGGLMRLFGIYPAVRAAMAGTAVASVIGGVLGGAALDVAGAAGALVVPMAALASLRVLDHSTDRTLPGESRQRDDGPDGSDGGGLPGGGAVSDRPPAPAQAGPGDDAGETSGDDAVARRDGTGGERDGGRTAGEGETRSGEAAVPPARAPDPAERSSTEVAAG
ncbi:MFS transporter [Micromonospora sp. KC723]|uniref:MFS transporter n=1 Tax=Micromonospora sp. KC723 TaxID=2530381 RepID=UPI0010497114|nr:MFS transporter [Micromonospora sp. KC723]TDB74456.1 MFS transporter [Micromonospora sp. KC723]